MLHSSGHPSFTVRPSDTARKGTQAAVSGWDLPGTANLGISSVEDEVWGGQGEHEQISRKDRSVTDGRLEQQKCGDEVQKLPEKGR